jgi:DNA-binding SARP family transcriptional activator
LTNAWKWAKSKQALQNMCGIAMHLWALYHEIGNTRGEMEYLKFFGETAEKKGYVYFREMSFASLVRTCARCAENNIAPKYMSEIIGKYFGFDAAGAMLRAPAATALDPGGFIRRFAAAAEPESTNVRIKLFGNFELAADGKKMDPDLFKTRKISGILKCVLANPGRTVSREKLAAAFWPEAGGKAAQNSLRVALFELRKILAAMDMPFDSGKALIAEDGDGLYICRPETVESDVSKFISLHDALRAGRLSGENEIAALTQLTSLYDGDYLEGVDAEDCAVDRAHYMAVYVEASYKLAEYYLREGKTELAEELILKHLRIDPFDEKLCGLLVELYRDTGRARQAASLKRRFTIYFEKEMGVAPEF